MNRKNRFKSTPKICHAELVSASQKAFTLAEVLITLAIIGVVAALTIPTVVKNYQKQQTVTKLKKAYSELQQAINLSQVDNGFLKDWDYTKTKSIENSENNFNKYFRPYLKISKDCPSGWKSTCGQPLSKMGVNMILANGTQLSFVMDSDEFNFQFDINAAKGPNKMGVDIFYFLLNRENGLHPFGFPTFNDVERNQIIKSDNYGCNNENTTYSRHYCTALIMYDHWQIKDDYP